MVKVKTAFVVILLLLAIMSGGINAASPSLVLTPSEINLDKVGDTATASINFYALDDLFAFDIKITYDPEVVEVVSLEKGSAFDDRDSFSVVDEINNEKGYVHTAKTLLGEDSFSSEGELTLLTIKAIGEGSSDIKIDSTELIASAKEGPVSIDGIDTGGKIKVSGPETDPDPKPDDPEREEFINFSVEKRTIGEGDIISRTRVELKSNDTPYSVLEREASKRGINVRSTGSGPSLYVSSIDGLSEFDHGPESGWMYSVNGEFSSKSPDEYRLEDGDRLRWRYTTELGRDLEEDADWEEEKEEDEVESEEIEITGVSLKDLMDKAATWILENGDFTRHDGFRDWDVLALMRAGKNKPQGYMEVLKDHVAHVIEEEGGFSRVTEKGRIVLVANSTGINPGDLAGHDLIERIYSSERMTNQGTNGPVFSLIALDSKDHKVPQEALWTRERLVDWILDQQVEDGGFPLHKEGEDSPGDVDVTAMALQALSNYQDQEEVEEAVEKALEWLSEEQLKKGGFESWGEENCEPVSQVIIALTALDMDPQGELFVKEEGDLLASLVSFANEDGGFAHAHGEESNEIATQQALMAITAYQRWFDGKNSLYDLTDESIVGEEEVSINRLYGETRIETAVAVSQELFPEDNSADALVLARADLFPDALAGAPLAKYKNAPLLLTPSHELDNSVKEEIQRVLTKGGMIYLLGGEAAISSSLEDNLKEDYPVVRLGGRDRYETAVKIAEVLEDKSDKVFLSTGENFPDALAVSSVAAKKGAPILLTHPDILPEKTSGYLKANQERLKEIIVTGGKEAVEERVYLEAGATKRLWGEDRFHTAKAISQEYFSQANTLLLARGDDFPDALSGGVLAADREAPVLLTLTDNVPPGTQKVIENIDHQLEKIFVIGGQRAISERVIHRITQLIPLVP